MEAAVCIEQTGTVEETTGQLIRVRIHRESLCSQCHARGMCYMGEGNDRLIEISDFESGIKTGDLVKLVINRKAGNKAIILGYLVPFIILISVLLIMDVAGMPEWVSGLTAIGSLIPYFLLLYFIRDSLRKKFTVTAHK